MLTQFGGSPLPEDRVVAMVGDGAPTLVQRACAAAGLSLVPEDALGYFLQFYDAHLLDNTRPYPATHDMLRGVAKKATLAVLTNKPERASIRILAGTGLLPFFQHVIAGDGPWPRKPNPQGLEWLMTKTGCPRSSTVLVGDSIVDLRTARAAGVRICLARYGFGFDSLLPEQLNSDDRVIDSPSDLLELFGES
jgi:phosphoglycolate phosphatase